MASEVEIFQDPRVAAQFMPRYGGWAVNLDEEATAALLKHYGGRHAKNRVYILLTHEGSLDPNWPFETEWEKVTRRVVEGQLLVYNNRTKRCTRPVWHQPLHLRTRENFSWERVRLFPVERVVAAAALPAHAKLVDNL